MSKELKCVVMGGNVFNVEVIGPNPSIEDGFYVRYEDGGSDTFRSKWLLERPESTELEQLRKERDELKTCLQNYVDAIGNDHGLAAIGRCFKPAKELLDKLNQQGE